MAFNGATLVQPRASAGGARPAPTGASAAPRFRGATRVQPGVAAQQPSPANTNTGQPTNWLTDIGDVAGSFGAGLVDVAGMGLSGLERTVSALGELARPRNNIAQMLEARGVSPEIAARMGEAIEARGTEELDWLLGDQGLEMFEPGTTWAGRTGTAAQEVAAEMRPPPERETLATDIAGGLGSVVGYAGATLLSPTTGLGLMVGAGAEEQAQRVEAFEQETSVPLDKVTAAESILLGGIATGISERTGIEALLRVSAPIKNAVVRSVVNAGLGGGIEAVEETVETALQDLIEQGMYNPDQSILGGIASGDWREQQAAGGAGAVFTVLRDAVMARINRRGRTAGQDEQTQPEQEPAEETPVPATGATVTASGQGVEFTGTVTGTEIISGNTMVNIHVDDGTEAGADYSVPAARVTPADSADVGTTDGAEAQQAAATPGRVSTAAPGQPPSPAVPPTPAPQVAPLSPIAQAIPTPVQPVTTTARQPEPIVAREGTPQQNREIIQAARTRAARELGITLRRPAPTTLELANPQPDIMQQVRRILDEERQRVLATPEAPAQPAPQAPLEAPPAAETAAQPPIQPQPQPAAPEPAAAPTAPLTHEQAVEAVRATGLAEADPAFAVRVAAHELGIPQEAGRSLGQLKRQVREELSRRAGISAPTTNRFASEMAALERPEDLASKRAARVGRPAGATGQTTPPTDAAIVQRARAELDKRNLKGVAVRLEEALTGDDAGVAGQYWRGAITLFRQPGATMEQYMSVLNHEMVHAMRRLGVFNEREWRMLRRHAQRNWRKRFNIDREYRQSILDAAPSATPEQIEAALDEEAIAEAIRAYMDGRLDVEGLVARILERIKQFLEALINAARGVGFVTPTDIMEQIRTGAIKDRVPVTKPQPSDPDAPMYIGQGLFKDTTAQLDTTARDEAFRQLASKQRGAPEQAMLRVQFAMGGGVLNPLVEHVGDLTHRMSEMFSVLRGGLENVEPKVRRSLRYLRSGYGFEREYEQNMQNNANARGVSVAEFKSRLDDTLRDYADEHKKLPVYNEPQRLARDAAVALGEQNWDAAERHLAALEELIERGAAAYEEAVSEYDPAFERPAQMRMGRPDPQRANMSAQEQRDYDQVFAGDSQAGPLQTGVNAMQWVRRHGMHNLLKAVADQYRFVYRLEKQMNGGVIMNAAVSAWKALNMARNMEGIIAGFIDPEAPGHGRWDVRESTIKVETGTIDIIDMDGNQKTVERKPLGRILQRLAELGKIKLWAQWLVANRAHRLLAEGRGQFVEDPNGSITKRDGRVGFNAILNFPTEAEQTAWINRYRSIDTQHTVADPNGGQVNIFRQAADEWTGLNKAVLDIAQVTGLINAQQRQVWEKGDYLPFYRAIQDSVLAPYSKSEVANQRSGIFQLRGKQELLGDPIENMVLNITHLLSASVRNDAMQRVYEIGRKAGMIVDIPPEERLSTMQVNVANVATQMRKLGIDIDRIPGNIGDSFIAATVIGQPKGSDVASFMVGGKIQWVRVNEPELLEAILTLRPKERNMLFRMMGWTRHVLTKGVTITPDFMLRNIIRDTAHTWVTVGARNNFGLSVIKGGVDAARKDPDLWQMAMSGGLPFGFYEGGPVAYRKRLERMGGRAHGALSPVKWWRGWQAFGAAFENANRMNMYRRTYDQMKKKGQPATAEAAFQALDLMNFSSHGGSAVVQELTHMIPFLNARIQGLYKLGRAARQNPKGFMLRGGILTFLTLMLDFWNDDDERYEALEDWDKDTFYHVFLDKIFPREALEGIGAEDWNLRGPKPFEVGAFFSMIPSRLMRLAFGKDDWKTTQHSIMAMITDTFAVGWPQAMAPIIEQVSNRIFFLDRPIEGLGMQSLLPEARYTSRTSDTARVVGEVMPDFLGDWANSPARIEHLVRGYFGGIGSYILSVADLVAEPIVGAPEEPARRTADMPVIGGFLNDQPAYSTRWLTEFYDLSESVDSLYRTMREYERRQEMDEVRALRREYRTELAARPGLQAIGSSLRDVNDAIRAVERNRNMTAEQKRRRLDNLLQQRNRIAERVIPILRTIDGR